jgi:hypothetical protein
VQLETSLLNRQAPGACGNFAWVPSTPGQKSASTPRSAKQMTACSRQPISLQQIR